MELDGAQCLITGCSSGIGRATAVALARAGARVRATARRAQDLEDLAREGIAIAELDVTDAAQVARVVAGAGRVDILINNAGYGLEGAIEEVADDELLAQYDTNVFGPWRLCRAVLPQMRERGSGAIVQISSFGGIAPFPGIGAYRSSKFALEGMTWSLDLEVRRFGIRVISIQPGLVDSDFGTRSIRRPARSIDAYEPMRASAARAYPRMSPEAMAPEAVADVVVRELRADDGPLQVPVGEDAERLIGAFRRGAPPYERVLVDELDFDWHPPREAAR